MAPGLDLHNVREGDDVTLVCHVKAIPEPKIISWYHKMFHIARKKRKFTEERRKKMTLNWKGSQPIPEENYTTQDLTSRLTYHVHDEEYYRNVTCYGENLVGKMEEPCEFQVTPAGKPDPLDNCTVFNQSSEALFVYCFPGYNGGLKQHFGVHVYEDAEGIRLNIKNHTEISEPKFTVDGLRAETEYLLSIYAENSKGKSEERKIYGFTLPAVGRPGK
ncbi:hypothetical protein E2C01_044280 [Portunus trituberculatus]|uniref:Ig-like domain-containing protein n=1 Tax=Portunus trituberculatus TaxID=210409 RepID=A0A5B7FV78_PORTR|nr:hypothetical protein [Portunus trituberculatus]